MIFDTHAHYDDKQFDEDRAELLSSLPKQGVGRVVNVAADWESVADTLALSRQYDHVFAALGIHPSHTAELDEVRFSILGAALRQPKVVAVGEIGLDYYWKEPEKELQKEWFIKQLELAEEVKKPVIIHSRDAAADTLELMQQYGRYLGGIIHCYSYSVEMAKNYLDMGYYLGIGGVVTFANGRKLHEVVQYAPLDRLVLETDCPYLSPEPFRGRGNRNSSLRLPYVIKKIAELKQVTPEEVEEATWKNACQVYRLQE
ncbi:MAG: TatD family hydrolase [Lachnospiraceae bacterium]|nr:TatD family hydrolase [Lachnospiraceae bacterium]